jgi:Arm DNA-binding domain
MGSTPFKRLGLGKYPEVGLAVARSRAERKRAEVADGADPQGERKAKREADRRALTFNTLADSYLEQYARQHKASWRNDQLYLRADVRPVQRAIVFWGASETAQFFEIFTGRM